ncbi:sugar 3,4-ketoisomerase [Algoriphagus sanaruensis]|nr:FdtA/QdtA family cupin domain-containing protein [Algoriphagus sanaruensis]
MKVLTSPNNFSLFQPASLVSIEGVVSKEGMLHYWDDKDLFPNGIQRCFWITQVSLGEFRGQHAHREEVQVLVCLSGQLKITVEGIDGSSNEFTLDHPGKGLLVPPLNWVKVSFGGGGVLLGLSDRSFDESDYIRLWDDFKKLQRLYRE